MIAKKTDKTPVLEITPISMLDQPLAIYMRQLCPSQQVTLHACMRDDDGYNWQSEATFIANAQGEIDITTQAATTGTYTGVDANGLLWSMKSTNSEAAFAKTTLQPLVLKLTAKSNGTTIGEGSQQRCVSGDNIYHRQVRDNGLVGTFFRPVQTGNYPCIILLSGSSGRLREPDAALLATHGYCTLALAYFKQESLPPSLEEIPLEYFERALEWLQAQPEVNAQKISVMGISKGGELALLLGSMFPEIAAVISYAPSAVIFEGLGQQERCSSWSYQGKSLPFVPYYYSPEFQAYADKQRQNEKPIAFRQAYLDSLHHYLANTKSLPRVDFSESTPTAKRETFIAVEKINGPILLIAGEDDQMWPADLFAQKVYLRLKKYHHIHKYEYLIYKQAGHKIGYPYLPTTVNREKVYRYGGNEWGNAHATADSWQHILTWLAEL